jgi:hypothetical protein
LTVFVFPGALPFALLQVSMVLLNHQQLVMAELQRDSYHCWLVLLSHHEMMMAVVDLS